MTSGGGDCRMRRTTWKHGTLYCRCTPRESWWSSHHPCTAPPPTGPASSFQDFNRIA
jgi:hypothetical protein